MVRGLLGFGSLLGARRRRALFPLGSFMAYHTLPFPPLGLPTRPPYLPKILLGEPTQVSLPTSPAPYRHYLLTLVIATVLTTFGRLA
ncbi:hypothetical protein VTN31DRAFT_2998 [Thermomyces dupontii]|uniref:uncharacterized protein n=1 Tax=Talaromyces thermophilus TaxID=28565 RepID=UPI0037444DEB